MSEQRVPEHSTPAVRKRLRDQSWPIRVLIVACPLGLVPLVVLLALSEEPPTAVLWLLMAWVLVLLGLVLAGERARRGNR